MGFFKRLHKIYGKCPKILNSLLFLFSNKMLLIRAGIHRMPVRIGNRENPDHSASSEAVWCRSALFFWAFWGGN